MATIAVDISKSILWRGVEQIFSNVYHVTAPTLDDLDDVALINSIADAERACHNVAVSFVEGRTYGDTELPKDQVVGREIVDLEGSGLVDVDPNIYRECAFLVIWPLGRYGKRNRPQYLRKWLHTGDSFGINLAVRRGEEPMTTVPNPISDYITLIAGLQDDDLTGPGELATADGRTPIKKARLHPYFEHRQLGDLWRTGALEYLTIEEQVTP